MLSTVARKGQTQISLPKHKTISQNTNQFTKTQINFPKHKSIHQNTKQFLKTQTSFPKHKSVYQNTNQFLKTQTNFAKHKSKDWALALSLSESLEGTHSQDFPCPTWRLLMCCPDVRKCSATTVGLKSYKSVFFCSQWGTQLDIALPSFRSLRKGGRRGLLTFTVGSVTTLFFAFLRSIMTCRSRYHINAWKEAIQYNVKINKTDVDLSDVEKLIRNEFVYSKGRGAY